MEEKHYMCWALFFLLALYSTLIDLSLIIRLKTDIAFISVVIAASIIIGAVLAAAVCITNHWINNRTFLAILITIAFLLRLGWILWIPTPVQSDFAEMYQGAVQAAKGDFSFSKNPYFSAWVYQLGFTMYEALIVRVFGEGLFILKLLNVLYCTGTVFLVYQIAARLFNESSARMAGVIYAVYTPSILMCSVLTNEHIAHFLFYLGFYLLIRKGFHWQTWLYTGILLALGDIMRPLGSFILLALGLYLFFLFLRNGKRAKLQIAGGFAGILAVFYIVHYIVSYGFIAAGVTQYPLSNRDPLWKFVLGFNHETNGQYSAKDEAYIAQFPIGEQRMEAERQLIQERLSDTGKTAALFKEKFKIMWGANDAAVYWSLGAIERPNVKDILFKTERVFYSSMLLFAAAGLFFMIRKSENDLSVFFLLLVLGYAAVHLLIEIQTRYRPFIIPSFAVFQGYGIFIVFTHLWNKYKRT
nr:glycosyltransferase family 39 protein [Ectobacillus panaciterrae]